MKDLAIDKSKWKKTKLGDIAEDISVRVDNPSESKFDRFVGLEHFISGDLKIKNWANTDNLVSAAKAFKAGDILFARRNAYLRRASLVEFDGVCSGDAFVLREDNSKIIPGFLAFVLNSEKLWDFANANAAGTMSKRVKWRDLANFEFLLPPIDQQEKLSELLWSIDTYVEKIKCFKERITTYLEVFSNSIFNNHSNRMEKLGSCLLYTQYGISEELTDKGEIAVVRMNNISEGKVKFENLKYISKSKIKDLESLALEPGDILFNRTNSFDLVGKLGIVEKSIVATFASYLIRLKVDPKKIMPEYLNLVLNCSNAKVQIKKHRTPGVSQSNINPENLKSIEIPVPSISNQLELVEIVRSIDLVGIRLNENIKLSKGIVTTLISNILSYEV